MSTSIRIAVRLPDELVEFLDELVERGDATSRAAAVAQALERERRRWIGERDAAIPAGTPTTPTSTASPAPRPPRPWTISTDAAHPCRAPGQGASRADPHPRRCPPAPAPGDRRTTTVRGLATEVPVGPTNGLEHDSVVSCNNIVTVPVDVLGRQLGFLLDRQETALTEAIRIAFDLW